MAATEFYSDPLFQRVQYGPAAQLPTNPQDYPVGFRYLTTDTGQRFIIQQDDTGPLPIRTWRNESSLVGPVTITGTLSVTGNTSITGNLAVTGNATITGSIQAADGFHTAVDGWQGATSPGPFPATNLDRFAAFGPPTWVATNDGFILSTTLLMQTPVAGAAISAQWTVNGVAVPGTLVTLGIGGSSTLATFGLTQFPFGSGDLLGIQVLSLGPAIANQVLSAGGLVTQ